MTAPPPPHPLSHPALVRRARALLDSHVDEPLPLAHLARELGVSASHLQRTFTRLVGISPRRYQEQYRLRTLKRALRRGQTVSGATYDAGFASGRRVYETAGESLGMTPGTYRRGGRGVTIHHAIVATTLGRLLVAVTARGVCRVALGDDDDTLRAELAAEFPDATLLGSASGPDRLIDSVIAHVEGRSRVAELPLDVQATAFQWQVWHALQRIPEGATRSYGEIAAALGRPSAARAVARACASNRLAILIPCHRVIRADGLPGGYRWGMERKAALLARERARGPQPG